MYNIVRMIARIPFPLTSHNYNIIIDSFGLLLYLFVFSTPLGVIGAC
jgi:hypothetical protein